jgi:hypothetical protein
MNEKMQSAERYGEKIPDEREVMQKVDGILEGRGCRVLKRVEDEQGLSQLDIATNDTDGQRLDISYTREGVDIHGKNIPPTIHQTLYYGDIPVSSGTHYEYLGKGVWKEIL